MNLFLKIRQQGMSKISVVCDWTGLIFIAGYSYLASIYLSNFAELHITIPKINLPVFVGEILVFIVVILLGVKIFLAKNYQRDRKSFLFNKTYLLFAGIFTFIIIKAFWGVSRHGFLAFRNAAMFYYCIFAFAGYYFYQGRFAKLILRYVILIILTVISFFSLCSCYFLYAYYAFIFILFLKMPAKEARIIGFLMLFIIFLRNVSFFFQSKAGIIALGVVLIYLIFNLGIYLYRKFGKRKSFVFSFVFIVAVLFSVCIWMMNTDLYGFRVFSRMRACLNFPKYSEQYQLLKNRINSRLANGMSFSSVVEKNQIYEKNLKCQIIDYKQIISGGDSKQRDTQIEGKIAELKSMDFVKGCELEKKVAEIREEIKKDIDNSIIKEIKTFKPSTFQKQGEYGTIVPLEEKKVGEKIVDLRKKEIEKVVRNKVQRELTKSIPPSVLEAITEGIVTETKVSFQVKADAAAKQIIKEQIREEELERTPDGEINNIMWRVFVWKDMLKEVTQNKKTLLWGVDFGYPFRSKNVEVLRWHDGGDVGWLEPHNSYLHIFYRAGIIGIIFIFVVLGLFVKVTLRFVRDNDLVGIMLTSVLLYWMTFSCFTVVLELPYYAIPFWSLFGLTLKYSKLSVQGL